MMNMGNPFYLVLRIWRGRKAPLALLLVFLAAFIWWIGPKLPYPFNSVVVRGFIIIAIVAVFGGVSRWRKKKRSKNTDALVAAVVEPDESEILKKRFKSAVNTLKTSQKAGRKGLVDLPWYIIIGPPGSGKTTLLRNAGLNFPIEDESGGSAIKGVGGTRDCDWWFADEAVLLDTAGRYTTQDSNEDTDRKAWLSFLDLLRGRRRKRPINGIFVAIGADILQAQSNEAIQEHAATIRKRVLELYTQLKGQFPIYLLVTKIDLVPGFTEFFESLNASEREQVWGYTQQIIRNAGEVAKIDATFDGEFDLLLSRLAAQSLDRIRDEPDPNRRALILGFPEQMARARQSMRTLVTHGFSPNAYQEKLLLRGLYMTSGTQEGAPIDRMMGGLAKAMNIDPQVARVTKPTGRSFFIKDLLSKVAFPEQDLLGIGFRQAQTRRKIQIGSYIGIVSAAALALISWTYIYYQERDYVLEAESALIDYRETVQPLPSSEIDFEDQARAVVLRLDQLRKTREDVAAADPANTMLGLPGDDALIGSIDKAYHAQLEQALAPLIVSSLTNRLQRRDDMVQEIIAFNPFEVNLLSTFVRAYGSLEDPRGRLKSKEAKAAFYDAVMYDLNLRNPDLARDLQGHVYAWVYQPRGPIARQVDQGVLEGARTSLAFGGDGLGQVRSAYSDWLFRSLYRAEDAVENIQSQEKEVISEITPGLVNQIGGTATEVFRRKSGRNLNEPIPLIFTRAGFLKFFADDQSEILDEVSRRSWVYSVTDDIAPLNKAEAKRAISQAYVNDYIQFWRALMADVTIRQSDRGDVLRVLSRKPSPLKEYLKIVSSNTQLEVKKKSSGPVRIGGVRIGARPSGRPQDAEATPKERVTGAFENIAELLGTEEEPGKIDEVISDIRTLANEVAALKAGDTPIGNTTEAKRSLETLARDMEGTGTNLDVFMRDILGTANRTRTEGEISQLDQIYRQTVYPICRRKISGRYPFTKSATQTVGLRDLEDVFGPSGVMTRFINENLQGAIDRSRGGWTWKPSMRSIAGDSASLRQFERAERITGAFFNNGQAQMDFGIKPLELGDAATRAVFAMDDDTLDFYGQTTRDKRQMDWPAENSRLELYGPGRPEVIYSAEGDWSLFRILDEAKSNNPLSGGTSSLITFRDTDRSVTFRVDTDSVDNPISSFNDWRAFRCPTKLW